MKALTKLFSVMLVVLLAGCATPEIKHTDQSIVHESDSAGAEMAKMRDAPAPYFRTTSDVWVGSRQIKKAGPALPPILNSSVNYSHNYPVTLNMVAEYLSTNYGLSVTVTDDALVSASTAAYDPVLALIRRDKMGTSQQQSAMTTGTTANQTANPAAGAFLLEYEGPIKGLLDQATARTGTAWKLVGGDRIVIFGLDTRTFTLHVLPGSASLTSTITNSSESGGQNGSGGGGSSGGGSSGGSSGASGQTQSITQSASSGQTTEITTNVELVKSTADTVKSMLTKRGQMAVSEGAAAITVTDVPVVLDRIQEFVDQLNDRMTRQVVIDVRVYSVDLDRTENYGINWNMVWQSISGRYQVTTSAQPEVNANAAQLNLSVIDPSFTYGGSQILVNALSEQGNVSIKTSAAVATLSNQPVPVQVAQSTSYIAQIQNTLVANAGTQSSVTPGQVTTGFTMNVLPVVLDGSDILMEVQINLSTLTQLRSVTSDGQTIELPDVNSRQMMQKVKIHSGSTLVMGGFEQDSLNTDGRGVGSPIFSLLGGSQTSDRHHTVLVVTMTPRVTG